MLISLFALTSCSIKKQVAQSNNNSEKDKQKFIYLFSEANKNRLLGHTQKAIEFYMTAIDVNPKSAASNYYLASLFFGEKEYSSALTFSDKATKLQPNNLWYNLLKGDILYTQDNVNEAYTQYVKLQKQYPKNELLYDRIIEILLDKIKQSHENKINPKQVFNDLIYIYNEKQKHFGFDAQIAEYLYNIYIEIKNIEKAKETLQLLTKKEPDNPKYKAILAENYVKSNEYNKAEKLFSQLLKKYPKNIDVKLSYAKYCKYTGKSKEYFNIVKNLLQTDLEFNKKVSLIISGRHPNFPPKEYEELLNILYKDNFDNLYANTLLSEYYIEKDKQKALPYILKAADLSNGDFNLVLTLFELAYDTQNFELLYQQSKKYLELYPNQAKVFLYNGIGAYKTERFKEAISVLNMGKDFVIEDNQLLLQFHFYLAETYHSLNKNIKSDEQFDKVIQLNPKFYLALNNYSYYLSQRKDKLQKALSMVETCLLYKSENPIFNDTYAKALFANKQYSKALIYIKKAIKTVPNNIDFLENYGDILFANNNKQGALKNWKLSGEYGNKSEKLLEKIKNINIIKIEDL